MPTQERAKITRAAIIDAAARAFDVTGFRGTSLADICKEAGVTKGALYFHFQSKEAVARAVIDEQFGVWDPFAGIDRPGVQTVIDLLHLMADSLQNNVRVRASIRLVVEQSTFDRPDPAPYQQWIETFRDCLAQAQGRGDIKPDIDVANAARLIVSSWTGIQLSAQVLTGRKDLRERTTDMWEMLLPGLVPPRRLGRFHPQGSPGLGADLQPVEV